jgi:hypothetical protein
MSAFRCHNCRDAFSKAFSHTLKPLVALLCLCKRKFSDARFSATASRLTSAAMIVIGWRGCGTQGLELLEEIHDVSLSVSAASDRRCKLIWTDGRTSAIEKIKDLARE